jgi:hypothetical protein
MLASNPTIVAYRHATKDLRRLPERQQILSLKYELFHALERAHDFQDRTQALELDVARLAVQTDRLAEPAESSRAVDELSKLRLALATSEQQRESLETLCRSLLGVIDDAVDDLAGEGADPAPEDRTAAGCVP